MRQDGKRRLGVTLVMAQACLLGLSMYGSAGAQSKALKGWDSYKLVDEKAIAAKDEVSVRALSEAVVGGAALMRTPSSFRERIARAQLAFQRGQHESITESALADAINYLGKALGGAIFTGTNRLQVHIFRVALFASLPNLLASRTPAPEGMICWGPDLSPAGAAYVGISLLSQKLVNPTWFGDPDEQNRRFASWSPPPPGSYQYKDTVRGTPLAVPPKVQKLVSRLEAASMEDETSRTTARFHEFLDRAGFQR
jgi:hypothetical protein